MGDSPSSFIISRRSDHPINAHRPPYTLTNMPRTPSQNDNTVLNFASPETSEFQPYHQIYTPLPRLTARRQRNETVKNVEVYPIPSVDPSGQQHWIVRLQPDSQIGKRQAIRLCIGACTSGVGRISDLAGMSRHWVSFKVSGSRGTCCLQVPIPWALLPPVECLTHTRLYTSLARLPAPHPLFAPNPIFATSDNSPYEFENWTE